MSVAARWLLLGACLLLAALGYAAVIPAYFVADDFVLLHGLQDGSTGLAAIGMRRGAPFLRPVLGATFWLEHQLCGSRPWHMHGVGILLHAAAAFGLGRMVELWANGRAGVLAALLFATLPVAPEAVSWISARGYPLAGLAIVTLLWLTLQQARAPRATFSLSLGVGGLAALALLSVEPAFPLAALVVCLGVRRGGWRVRGAAVAAALATVAYLLLRLWWLGDLGGYRDDNRHAHFDVMQTARYLGQALGQLVVPGPWDGADGVWLTALLGVELAATVLLLAITPWRRDGWLDLVALLAAALAALAITATWATLGDDLSGSRYLYFAALFRCAAVGQLAAAAAAGRRPGLARAAVVTLVAAQLGLLITTNQRWRVAGDHAEQVLLGLRDKVADGARQLVLHDVPSGERGVHILPWAVDAAVNSQVDANVRVAVATDAAQFAQAQAYWRGLPPEQRRLLAVGVWDAAARVWRWE